jgi:hypothetical protein
MTLKKLLKKLNWKKKNIKKNILAKAGKCDSCYPILHPIKKTINILEL